MRVIRNLAQVRLTSPTFVTIGVFDGVHRGHQRIIDRMVRAAHATDKMAAVYTFDPHPLAALGREAPLLLTTVDERAEIMAKLDVDLFVVPPFTQSTTRVRAADFAAMLVQELRMIELWAGPDFALGYQREGDVPLLQRVGADLGYAVRVVQPLIWDGARVSSSRVRAALEAGEIHWATSCLGRSYRLAGEVTGEHAWAHWPDLPVIAFSPLPGRVIPAAGVYACRAHLEGVETTYPALIVISDQSVLDPYAERMPTVGAHLLGLERQPRGGALALDFAACLAGEGELPHPTLLAQVRDAVAQMRVPART